MTLVDDPMRTCQCKISTSAVRCEVLSCTCTNSQGGRVLLQLLELLRGLHQRVLNRNLKREMTGKMNILILNYKKFEI